MKILPTTTNITFTIIESEKTLLRFLSSSRCNLDKVANSSPYDESLVAEVADLGIFHTAIDDRGYNNPSGFVLQDVDFNRRLIVFNYENKMYKYKLSRPPSRGFDKSNPYYNLTLLSL